MRFLDILVGTVSAYQTSLLQTNEDVLQQYTNRLCAAIHSGDGCCKTILQEAQTKSLDVKAIVNGRCKNLYQWHTPLMFAANKQCSDEVKLLIARGADLQAVNADGWTALMFIFNEDNPFNHTVADAIKNAIIERHGFPAFERQLNHRNKSGWTAAHCAVQEMLSNDDVEMDAINWLIDKDANLLIEDSDGDTVFKTAIQYYGDLRKLLDYILEHLKTATKAESHFTHQNRDGWTAVHEMTKKGHSDLVEKAMKVTPQSAYIRDKHGLRPIDVAFQALHCDYYEDLDDVSEDFKKHQEMYLDVIQAFLKSDSNLLWPHVQQREDAILVAALMEKRNKDLYTSKCEMAYFHINDGEADIPVPKAYLTNADPYFQRIFDSQMKESTTNIIAVEEGVSRQLVDNLVHFLYTGSFDTPPAQQKDVVSTPEKLNENGKRERSDDSLALKEETQKPKGRKIMITKKAQKTLDLKAALFFAHGYISPEQKRNANDVHYSMREPKGALTMKAYFVHHQVMLSKLVDSSNWFELLQIAQHLDAFILEKACLTYATKKNGIDLAVYDIRGQ